MSNNLPAKPCPPIIVLDVLQQLPTSCRYSTVPTCAILTYSVVVLTTSESVAVSS